MNDDNSKVEPFFSSDEDQKCFTDWYNKKVKSNSVRKKVRKFEPSFPSVSTMLSSVSLLSPPNKPTKETDAFSSSSQVVNKEPMWVVKNGDCHCDNVRIDELQLKT